MTAVLTPHHVEQEGERLYRLLEEQTEALATMAEAAGQAEADYKRTWAQAYLQASGTEKARTAHADLAAAEALDRRKATTAIYESQREMLRTIRSQLDWLRSVNANVRSAST